jgi:hypothetical protein
MKADMRGIGWATNGVSGQRHASAALYPRRRTVPIG